MVTKFKSGRATYSLVTSPRSLREWDIPLSEIKPDPSVWSKRDKRIHRALGVKRGRTKRRSLGICE